MNDDNDDLNKQKKLFITMEEKLLLDLRKILFQYNLTPQFFFRFMSEKAVTKDSNMLLLLNEAKEDKLNYTRKNLDDVVDVDDIYELIRREQENSKQEKN